MKCNVDADFNTIRNTTNKGWCFRDKYERFINEGVFEDFGIYSILEAEAKIIKEAIQATTYLHLDWVIF